MQRLGFSPFNSETGSMYSSWPWTPSSPAQPLWVDKRLVPLLGTEMTRVLMLTSCLSGSYFNIFSFPVVPESEWGLAR